MSRPPRALLQQRPIAQRYVMDEAWPRLSRDSAYLPLPDGLGWAKQARDAVSRVAALRRAEAECLAAHGGSPPPALPLFPEPSNPAAVGQSPPRLAASIPQARGNKRSVCSRRVSRASLPAAAQLTPADARLRPRNCLAPACAARRAPETLGAQRARQGGAAWGHTPPPWALRALRLATYSGRSP